jgi:very-short-patch-repair endonuclease
MGQIQPKAKHPLQVEAEIQQAIAYTEVKLSDYVSPGLQPVNYKRARKYHTSTTKHKRNRQSKQDFLEEKATEMRTHKTFSESRLWREIYRYQILGLKFQSQVIKGDFIVDFLCPELSLAIEIDGKHHDNDDKTIVQDKKKTAYLKSLGYQVIRFKNHEVNYHLNSVLIRLWDICAGHLTSLQDDSINTLQVKQLIAAGNPYLNKVERFRLCELVYLTGIPKSTIQYYRRKGLMYTDNEQKDRSLIPSYLIQFYTREHLEKLKHVHSLRSIDEMPTRHIFYTFRCIEEAITLAKSPETFANLDLRVWLEKIKHKYYIPPTERTKIKYCDPPNIPVPYPSSLIPRVHVFAKDNPYGNTPETELEKLTLNTVFAKQLNLLSQQHSPNNDRSSSPLGAQFETLMQMTYEQQHLLVARYLAF